MSRKEETLTYKQNMSKTEVFHVIKAIGCPLIVFGRECKIFCVNLLD